jgi:hypothetical protein
VPPGGAPTPPECEGASLVRRRRTSTRPGIAGRRLPDSKDLFSGPASGLLRHQDASRVAPLGEQGAIKIRADSARGITFFRGLIPRIREHLAATAGTSLPLLCPPYGAS